MLRFPLHPTRTGWFAGIALIALWALLWLWFLVSLGHGTGDAQARALRQPPMATRSPAATNRTARA
jgi:hypothetical protein